MAVSGPAAGNDRDNPRRRLVLLGASNLTRGIGTVVDTARRIWDGPLEILAALGRGRSYGRPSRVAIRQLPGILECGLWRAVDALPAAPTAALVTDIGNDLLYEQSVDTVAAWVGECLDRLEKIDARTVVTLLPTKNLAKLSERRFYLFRRLLVPNCRLTLATIRERGIELSERVNELAIERGMTVVEHQTSWYGLDPVHIQFAQGPSAWREILGAWNSDVELPAPVTKSLFFSLYLQSFCQEERRLGSFTQRAAQPACRLRDGTTIALY